MVTPNDINGVRTDLIMQAINRDMCNETMPIPVYNQMYEIVYETLKKISIQNLHCSMKKLGIEILAKNTEPLQPEFSESVDKHFWDLV